MWSFSVILSFVLSFCKQDNWRTRKRMSTKLGRHEQEWLIFGGDLDLRVASGFSFSSSLRNRRFSIYRHLLALLCFLSSHTINSRFESNLAKWMTPTNVFTILKRIFDGHLNEAAIRNKRHYDIRVHPATFKTGDWVWYFNPRRVRGKQIQINPNIRIRIRITFVSNFGVGGGLHSLLQTEHL